MALRLDLERHDLASGVRAASATVLPLCLAWWLHRPELSWLALGGWLSSLGDPGGTRSKQAALLAVFAIVGGALVATGAFAHENGYAAAGVLAGVALLGSLLRATGAIGATFGTLFIVTTAIAASSGASSPLQAGALFALGTLWSTVLSSLLWPIWTHLPLRRALAQVFRALSAYAAHLHAPSLRRWQRPVRGALESARDVSVSLRARRFGESALGSNLRALLGVAESSFFGLIAIGEELRNASDPTLHETTRQISALYTEIATELERPRLRDAALEANDVDAGNTTLPSRVLAAAQQALRVARAPTQHWTETESLPSAAEEVRARLRDAGRAFVTACSPRSSYFRHAIRVACTALLAIWLGRWISPHHVAWVTVTALAVLQPYPGATWKRALERAFGTVLGCFVTAALMAAVHAPWALAMIMFPLSVAAVYTKPRSYRLFTFFLTPVFVLFLDAGQGDFWTVVQRGVDSGAGALIALIATFALFPSWEGARMASALLDVRTLLSRYALQSLDAVTVPRDAILAAQLTLGRRQLGVALGDAELSLERLLGEPRRNKAGVHRSMQQLTYLRRLTASLTALDMQRDAVTPLYSSAALLPLRTWLDAVVLQSERPRALPTLPQPPHEGLQRVLRQAQLLA